MGATRRAELQVDAPAGWLAGWLGSKPYDLPTSLSHLVDLGSRGIMFEKGAYFSIRPVYQQEKRKKNPPGSDDDLDTRVVPPIDLIPIPSIHAHTHFIALRRTRTVFCCRAPSDDTEGRFLSP